MEETIDIPKDIVSREHSEASFALSLLIGNTLKSSGMHCKGAQQGAFYCIDRNLEADLYVKCHGNDTVAPELVIEVLSPRTQRDDRTRKYHKYMMCGVKEYWLVSTKDKTVEVRRDGGVVIKLYHVGQEVCSEYIGGCIKVEDIFN